MIKKFEKGNGVLDYSFSGNDMMIEYHPSFTDKKNIKIKRAVLKLPIQNINTSIGYEVDIISNNTQEVVIDYFKNASQDNLVCIDISDEIQQILNKNDSLLTLKIKNANNNISLSDNLEIALDIYSKKQKINNSFYEFNCKRAGSSKINLSTGSLQFTHNDIASDNKILSIKIDHIFNSFLANKTNDNIDDYQLPNHNTAKGWKLNIQQYLIKEKSNDSLMSDEKTSGKFTYIDGNGNHHEFFERFFYLDSNNIKQYVTPSDVKISENEELSYLLPNGQYISIKKEIITESGFTLVNRNEGFNGISLIDRDTEEIGNLKKEIKDIKFTLAQINNSLTSITNNQTLLTKANAVTQKNQSIQLATLNQETTNITNERTSLQNRQNSANAYKLYRNALDDRTYENNQYPTEYSYKNNYNSESDTSENYDFNLTQSSLTSRESFNALNRQLYNLNLDYNSTQSSNQELELNSNLTLLTNQKNYYDNLLIKKTKELKSLQKRIPIHFITSKEGIMLGFACYKNLDDTSENYEDNQTQFRLIYISDNYENIVYISYNDNDQIEQVINTDNKIISFNYNNNNLLSSIIDERNRKTKFIYENDYLTKITYPNKKFSTFEYDNNGNLIKVIEPSGYGVMLAYMNNQVVEIDEITSSSKITKSSVTSAEITTNNEIEINYYDFKSTILTNVTTGKSITYVFDNLGNVLTTYENKFENGNVVGNVRATAFDNVNDKKSFTIQSLDFAEDFLAGANFENNPYSTTAENYLGDNLITDGIALVALNSNQTSDNTIYTLNSPNTANTKLEKIISTATLNKIINSGITDFVLSGWAKADSSWVERRLTDYSDNGLSNTQLDGGEVVDLILNNLDFIKANRRFELRAELTYSKNGNTRIVEQYCSYDWMNTDWQYCALPVTLSEDPNDKLIGLKFIFDYSYNTNSANFFGMTLKEGVWEYSEFDDEKQKTYYQNSKSKAFVTYEYEDNKLIKAIVHKGGKEYKTYYHYNTNGQLIRTTAYNGIITENEYNVKGSLIKSFTYHKDEPSAKLYSQDDILDEKGNSSVEVNEFGEEILQNSFIDQTGLIKTSKHKNGSIIAYGYDPDDDSLLSCSVNVNGDINSNVYGYNLDLLTTLSHNDFEYNFEYDGFGRQTKIEVAGNTYQDTNYQDSKTTTTLATGEKFIHTFDDSDNLTKTEYVDSQNNTKIITENTYDIYGKLLRTKDYSNNLNGVNYNLEYDKYGNVNKKSYTQNNKDIEINSITNVDENKTNETIKIDTIQNSIEYNYSNELDAKLQLIKFNNIVGQTISYDKLGRINQTKIPNILTKQYNYLQKGDHSSNLVASEWFGDESVIKDSLKYCYDENGNVTSIKENGVEIVRYSYDNISRLIREDNKILNKTSLFSYDNGGNIIERLEYSYSTLPTNKLSGAVTFDYDYPVSGWKDQLMKYNNKSFAYDNLGNPTTYKDKSLTWKFGRQLATFDTSSFNYNADGIRISKTFNNVTTQFYLDGTKILAQDNGNLLSFNYGVDGVIGFTYTGVSNYFYKKNIFGDIIGIINNNKQEIVKYVYDAWGNHKTYVLNDNQYVDIANHLSYTQDGLNNKFIAELNPFRYRSYYYDIETNLYYLNIRYYDPETGRFINADDISILNQSKEFQWFKPLFFLDHIYK